MIKIVAFWYLNYNRRATEFENTPKTLNWINELINSDCKGNIDVGFDLRILDFFSFQEGILCLVSFVWNAIFCSAHLGWAQKLSQEVNQCIWEPLI